MIHTIFYNPARIMRLAIAIVALPVLLSGCDDFVEVNLPNSQLTGSSVFQDKATATAALMDVYAQFRDYGLFTGKPTGIAALLGTYTDELLSFQTGTSGTEPFYNNAVNAENLTIQEAWARCYNQVYALNAVIEGVSASTGIEPQDKSQLLGEALFLRAYIHMHLAAIFNGCPYITGTDYRTNTNPDRLTSAQVYDKCIDDLTEAVGHLPAEYVAAEKVRPNKYAATALLARLYLYRGQWAAAALAAATVIDSGIYTWEPDLTKVFLKESTATLWQVASGGGYINTQEGATFIFNAWPPTTVSLREDLNNAFEQGDQRRVHWVRAVTDGNTTWFHPYKYKQDINSQTPAEHSVVLRLAELYLIRAEARIYTGDIAGAKQDINLIRNTAGLEDTQAEDPAGLLSAVMAQRRFEFFAEYGMRFFDLQRTGMLDQALQPVKPGWETTDAYWPIPQNELNLNPNLGPQNPGY